MVSAPCSACRADRNTHGAATEQLSTGRHRDKPAADNWPLPNYRLIKVFIAIFDIPESGGATVRRHSPTQKPHAVDSSFAFSAGGCTWKPSVRDAAACHTGSELRRRRDSRGAVSLRDAEPH